MAHQVPMLYSAVGPDGHQIATAQRFKHVLSWDPTDEIAAPLGITVFDGDVYVCDGATQIGVWDKDGAFQRKWTANNITAIVELGGEIYAADNIANEIEVYDTTGTLQRSWSVGGSPIDIATDGADIFVAILNPSDTIEIYNTVGVSLGSFATQGVSVAGVTVDGDGNVYALTVNVGEIERYTNEGSFEVLWGGAFGLTLGFGGRGSILHTVFGGSAVNADFPGGPETPGPGARSVDYKALRGLSVEDDDYPTGSARTMVSSDIEGEVFVTDSSNEQVHRLMAPATHGVVRAATEDAS